MTTTARPSKHDPLVARVRVIIHELGAADRHTRRVLAALEGDATGDAPTTNARLARLVWESDPLALRVLEAVTGHLRFGWDLLGRLEGAIGLLGHAQLERLTRQAQAEALLQRVPAHLTLYGLPEATFLAATHRLLRMMKACGRSMQLDRGQVEMAGRFADSGKLILNQAHPEPMPARPPGLSVAQWERAHCSGLDHARVGGLIMVAAGFEGSIVDAVRQHEDENPPSRPLSLACWLAARLARIQSEDAPEFERRQQTERYWTGAAAAGLGEEEADLILHGEQPQPKPPPGLLGEPTERVLVALDETLANVSRTAAACGISTNQVYAHLRKLKDVLHLEGSERSNPLAVLVAARQRGWC